MKDIIKIFKALSDPTRLRIMILLLRKDLCVCELTFILGMEQSRVSHHTRVLREAGIAEDVRDGRWIIYRVPDGARALLEGLVSGALRERIELSREAAGDVKKLDACLQQNLRGSVCESQPRAEG
ncbi:MAG: metalloregulator ArsR/SmtB family transcription factor [Acidobacteria bacterium]|jgi:ArsR family transcriptional regulator|nr:metalloregulator ArsR/SmtB family transcription factor [Acidobacteriota bacterium]